MQATNNLNGIKENRISLLSLILMGKLFGVTITTDEHKEIRDVTIPSDWSEYTYSITKSNGIVSKVSIERNETTIVYSSANGNNTIKLRSGTNSSEFSIKMN